MKQSISETAKVNKAELKKLVQILEKDEVKEKDIPKISNQTLEQMERAEYGYAKKLNSSGSKSHGGDKSVCSNFKRLEKVLKKAKLTPVIENGEFWLKIIKSDSNVKLSATSPNRKQRRELPTISASSITKEDWISTGFCRHTKVFYVWYNNVDLYVCEDRNDLPKLLEFMLTYFNSKYGNGLLITK